MNDRVVISELVRKLGGSGAVAMALGCNQQSVQKWAKNSRIPWKWRDSVKTIARRRGIKLSPDEWEVLSLKPAVAA